eukprot:TRINITY_DN17892_c0_g1_i2.p1 TRINITY_DN17892_c0_g1~~TRINITY_DN17892_c0_g1_i2.p1  ORF type:complete len:156 (-),score=23.41 TRINITY_DN17892_c0_g1_i2:70-537(-)
MSEMQCLDIELSLDSASMAEHSKRCKVGELCRRCCELVPTFLQRYVVYRHYRLAGWTVRLDSLKFGADFLLYDGRQDEVHADYAVILADSELIWKDAVMASRLAQTVAKELLLVSFPKFEPVKIINEAELISFLSSPSSQEIKEIALRRWSQHLQ